MESFKAFLEQELFVEKVLLEFDNPQQPLQQDKVWSAKKPEILQMWQNLRQDMPINITPMAKTPGVNNRSYGEDGVRVTGSWPFIASVLGRLKDILSYENPDTKLRLVFRGIEKERSRPDRDSFVFYVNVDQRSRGKAGRPKKLETELPQV